MKIPCESRDFLFYCPARMKKPILVMVEFYLLKDDMILNYILLKQLKKVFMLKEFWGTLLA
jgi:hypothetical protein